MGNDGARMIGALLLIVIELIPGTALCQAHPATATSINTTDLDNEIRLFLAREVAAHVADIRSFDPPPNRVVGALTVGEFSWGTFMRTLASYADFAQMESVGGREVAPMIAQMGLIEIERGGLTWAQLYAATALCQFGKNLDRNKVWQTLSVEERKLWRAFLDPRRFYDVQTHKLIRLPENYFGVAARIAVIDYQLGLIADRRFVDDLLNRAAQQFTAGNLFADDALPTGRYDRYSNEYARAIYGAAAEMGRSDLMSAIAPSLKEQMRLWWDLLSPDGYGYPWGRSLGAISYMDTLEIVGFLGQNPEFRPVPLTRLASAYNAAWRWLRNDFKNETHLLSMFAFGRGDYGYITKEREWQQTTSFLAKLISAHGPFIAALSKESVESFPAELALDNMARFEYFHNSSGRKFGVWVVREGSLQFSLPFVTGPRAAISDYEPAPHGLPGMAVPVEKLYPCLVPFLELEDGRTIVAADGADEISATADGRTITAKWKNWVVAGDKPGQTVDPGLETQVTWSIAGNALRRSETFTASREVDIKRLWMTVPSRADHLETILRANRRIDRLSAKEGTLEVTITGSDWPCLIDVFATGDDSLGRGARGAIPLHLIFQSRNVHIAPSAPKSWQIEFVSDSSAAH
jgi:hypothetical protein